MVGKLFANSLWSNMGDYIFHFYMNKKPYIVEVPLKLLKFSATLSLVSTLFHIDCIIYLHIDNLVKDN